MKKPFLSILLIMIVTASFGQSSWNITFDDTSFLDRVYIDTITHKNCIWKKKFSLIEITSKIAVKRKDEKKLSKIESLLIVMLE